MRTTINTQRLQRDLNELYEHSDKSIQVDNCLNHLVKALEIWNAFDKLFHRVDNDKQITELIKRLDHSSITLTEYNIIKEWLENEI